MRPARPANVAAAARAMKNMGLRRLTLVDPPPASFEREARALAYGAWDVLDAARRAASLADAVAGCAFVAGASSRGGAAAWSPRRLGRSLAERSRGGAAALVFGPEASGLSNQELRLCHETVTIPADPEQPSLNLAQAVLLVAYELRVAPEPETPAGSAGPPAASAVLEDALRALRDGLLAVGYLDPASPDPILAELRRLIARAAPSEREVGLLRGIGRQLAWAGAEVSRLRGRAPGKP